MTGHGVTRTSEKGVEFVASFEGFVDHCYNDPASPPNATIGYGHLLHHGPVTNADVHKWGTITHEQGLELLAQDLRMAEACVVANVHPPLTLQTRFDALVDFVFNCGCGPLMNPTTLHRALNNTTARSGMPAALLPYDHAGGVVLPGLARRRRAEARLWTDGVYGA